MIIFFRTYLGCIKIKNIMSHFSINSIKIYKETDSRLRKILLPGTYKFEGGLGDGFFAKGVNVCAIVGMNGSGKSSLLEILYRSINNLGAVLLKDFRTNAAANLMYVGGLYADVKYTIDECIGVLSIRGFQVGLKCDDKKWLFKIKDEDTHIDFDNFTYYHSVNNEQLKEISKHIFYSVVTNYSMQSYISRDYKGEDIWVYSKDTKEWIKDSRHNWIDSLFHKNDGYMCPINLNPYRENGKVDMVREDRLTNDRLQSILIDFKSKGHKYIEGYELEDIHYKFNRDKVNNLFENQYQRETREHKYNRLIRTFKDACHKENSIASIILHNFQVREPEYDHHIHWVARLYMVSKVLLIAQKYPSYNAYSKWGDLSYIFKTITSQDEKRELKNLGKTLRDDKSHVVLKLNRVLHFIKRTQHIPDIQKLVSSFTYNRYAELIGDNHKKMSISNRLNVMPPSFFAPEVIMRREQADGTKVLMPLRYMSSGERQFMHTTSATIYHLFNLKSIKNDSRPSYNFLNVVMDEVEICYHPEMQRTFVCRLIDLFKQLVLQNHSSINIIMTTHSPFILSDIPKCNIIYLENGQMLDDTDKFINPFGANVNDVLKQSFFLNNGFTGEFAKKKILSLVKFLSSPRDVERSLDLHLAQNLIDIIGEPLVKNNLQRLLDKYLNMYPDLLTPELNARRTRRIEQLQDELNILNQHQGK